VGELARAAASHLLESDPELVTRLLADGNPYGVAEAIRTRSDSSGKPRVGRLRPRG
jgi:hypothetical protein